MMQNNHLNELRKIGDGVTPKSLGYYFPAEFAKHDAIWLTWPHKEESWPGKIASIYPSYTEFVKVVALTERVCINVVDEKMRNSANKMLQLAGVDLTKVTFYLHPSNDAWCRDHGPSFLIRNHPEDKKAIVDWNINAWGGKYPPYDLDDVMPTNIAKVLNLPVFYPKIIMEGGSVDFNGAGTIMTSKSCLLNPNRNPHLNQSQIEKYLCDYYGMDQVLWVSDGIVGDDTDGHIDDTVRFVNEDTVITVIEDNVLSENHELLQQNLKELKQMRLLNGKQLNIVELPMPADVIYEDQMLPASYANFYISNGHIIVPTFRCNKDDKAMQIIQSCFPTRQVVGIDSTDIIWGLGSFHCLSQQEPSVD
jgi:agmatine deiminase